MPATVIVLIATAPVRFVSKDDVRAWPLIGWLAAMNETIFLARGSGNDRVTVAKIVDFGLAKFYDPHLEGGASARLTYEQLLERSQAFSSGLQQLGVRFGDRVATLAWNRVKPAPSRASMARRSASL